MGVHCSTMRWTMLLVCKSLCEVCISFPEAKLQLNGLEEVWVDRKCVG